MDNKERIVFSLSKVGAGHLPKGMPCQDYSLSWESEDGQNLIIVVCDGHGSSSYVRSDVGSRLAAEITKSKLEDFIAATSPSVFLNKSGAVTARPSLDESKWGLPPAKPASALTEMDVMLYKQSQQFCQQVKDIREQDTVICDLFQQIYLEWLDAIKKDSEDYPFSETERAALGDKDLVKAYGTTLQAYVQTPFYWLAFHIGDGRIVFADRNLNWFQPVPWDCNCYQNFTTSLCNNNPLRSLRYAFNGKGDFPVAVMCCSDGIEDSYGDFDLAPSYLYNFYTGLLSTILAEGKDIFMERLDNFLPKLSAAASKDDMSLAGAVYVEAIADGLKQWELRQQRDKLNAAHAERVKRQKKMEAELDKKQKEADSLNARLAEETNNKQSIIQKIKEAIALIKAKEEEANNRIEELREQLKDRNDEIEELRKAIDTEIEANKEEDEKAIGQKAELKGRHDELEDKIAALKKADKEAWQELIAPCLKINDTPSEDEVNDTPSADEESETTCCQDA